MSQFHERPSFALSNVPLLHSFSLFFMSDLGEPVWDFDEVVLLWIKIFGVASA